MQITSAILAFVGGLLMASNLFGTSRLIEFEKKALKELRSLSFGDIFRSKISLRIWRVLSGLFFFDFKKGIGRGSDYVVADPKSLREKWKSFRDAGGVLVDIGASEESWGDDFNEDAIQVSVFYYHHPDREEVISEGFSYSFASGFVHKIQILPPNIFGFEVVQDEDEFKKVFEPTIPKRFFIHVAPYVKVPIVGTVRIPNNPLFSTLIDQNVRKAIGLADKAHSAIMRMHLSEKHEANIESGFLHEIKSQKGEPSGKQSAIFLFDDFPHPHEQSSRPRASLIKSSITLAYVAVLSALKMTLPILGIIPTALALFFISVFEIYYLFVAILFNIINLIALVVSGGLYIAILVPVEFFARLSSRLTIESYTRFAGLALISVAFVLTLMAP